MRPLLTFIVTFIAVLAAFLPSIASAQFSEVGAHARLADGANAEANGGGDTSLVGINVNGVNNWGVNQWDLSSIGGDTVTGVTLVFTVDVNFANANHGSDLDTLSIHQIYDSNVGWMEGSQIVNGNNVQTNGGVTFNFWSQTSATTGTPWRDASGADIANFAGGAFDPTPIDTVAGYNQGAAPTTIEFTIPIATAQSWVDDPASFAGLVFLANDVDGDGRSRFNFVGNPATLTIDTGSGFMLGDVNMDGSVDFFDIQPFIDRLADQQFQVEADINMDDVVDFFDIAPFITILSSGG